MSNFQAIYAWSAFLVLIGVGKKSKLSLTSPTSHHFNLILQVALAPLILLLSCFFIKSDFEENEK